MLPLSIHVCVFLLSLISAETSAYNESQALDTLYYAYAAYCNVTVLDNWNCKWCVYDPGFDIRSNGAGVISTDALQAFIGFDAHRSQIVLSFRGTHNAQDMVDDLDMYRIIY